MTKAIKVVVVVLMAIIAVIFSTPLSAQKPSMFSSPVQCNAALASGNFAYYAPVDLSKRAENPIDNANVFGVKLEADSCRHQRTISGWKYVVQPGGSMMRADKDAAGNLVIDRRDDCGNADDTDQQHPVVPETPNAPTPQTSAPPAPATQLSFSSSNTTNNYYEGGGQQEPTNQPWPLLTVPAPKSWFCHTWCVVTGVAIIGVGIFAGYELSKGDNPTTTGGVVDTGIAKVAKGLQLRF